MPYTAPSIRLADGGLTATSLGAATATGPRVLLDAAIVSVENRDSATNITFGVKGMAAQSGDLQRWLDNGGTTLAAVTSNGRLNLTRNAASYSLQIVNPNATGQGIAITIGSSGYTLVGGRVSGDSADRIFIDGTGKLHWGSGSASTDTFLYRSAAGALKTDGTLTANGFVTPISTKTADYTLTASDSVILANAALTATLPSAVTAGAGRHYTVKNIHGSATVTLAATAGTIDGAATLSLAAKEAVTTVSDGANWWAI